MFANMKECVDIWTMWLYSDIIISNSGSGQGWYGPSNHLGANYVIHRKIKIWRNIENEQRAIVGQPDRLKGKNLVTDASNSWVRGFLQWEIDLISLYSYLAFNKACCIMML
jgi:hypothetical protein